MLPPLGSLRQPGGSRVTGQCLPVLMQEFRSILQIGRRSALGVELGNVMISSESKIKPCRPLMQQCQSVRRLLACQEHKRNIFSQSEVDINIVFLFSSL